MEAAKIFTNGGSQAVRLPKSCQFSEKEVLAHKVGDIVLLVPKNHPWQGMLTGLQMFTDDFLAELPEDLPPQERDFS